MKALNIDVIHYNKKKEQIDILSNESREKIKKAVIDIINSKIQK